MKTKKQPSKINKKNIKKEVRIVSPEIIKATEIASHYAFSPLPHVEVEKADISVAKKFNESHLKTLHPFFEKSERFGGFLEEKLALLRSFTDKKFADLPFPIMGFYEGPLSGNPHMKKSAEEETFNLEIIGGSGSVSEAIAIETSFVILKDRYPDTNFSIAINSIGDKESYAKFLRELTTYVSKEGLKLEKNCRNIIKKDITSLFNCSHEKCKEVQENAPKPMTYLSESSRNHFKQVLEYIESLGIPYEICHSLIGSRSYCSETICEIRGEKNGKTTIFGIGERYNSLAKKALGKKDVPAFGMALLIHPHFIKQVEKKKREQKIKFYYIQIGFDAKLKSLSLLENLRKANIHVHQALSKDKLSLQLAHAEKIGIPYIIMMGQREAMEGSVVVRKMSTMSQETVLLDNLISHLKKLP